jgi:AhpD family alkylhydroperoxidase
MEEREERTMGQERLSAAEVAPDGYKALIGVETYLRNCGLDERLIELVKMRASQINGCAYCLDMHSKDARRRGEREQRLYLLDAWREASIYEPRERAALAWTDAVTRLADTRAPDDVYEALRSHFSEKEIADLTILIGMINFWNRLAVGLRYQPAVGAAAVA